MADVAVIGDAAGDRLRGSRRRGRGVVGHLAEPQQVQHRDRAFDAALDEPACVLIRRVRGTRPDTVAGCSGQGPAISREPTDDVPVVRACRHPHAARCRNRQWLTATGSQPAEPASQPASGRLDRPLRQSPHRPCRPMPGIKLNGKLSQSPQETIGVEVNQVSKVRRDGLGPLTRLNISHLLKRSCQGIRADSACTARLILDAPACRCSNRIGTSIAA